MGPQKRRPYKVIFANFCSLWKEKFSEFIKFIIIWRVEQFHAVYLFFKKIILLGGMHYVSGLKISLVADSGDKTSGDYYVVFRYRLFWNIMFLYFSIISAKITNNIIILTCDSLHWYLRMFNKYRTEFIGYVIQKLKKRP